eukprot:127910-Pleurochrysis_carterae.AAC.7
MQGAKFRGEKGKWEESRDASCVWSSRTAMHAKLRTARDVKEAVEASRRFIKIYWGCVTEVQTI